MEKDSLFALKIKEFDLKIEESSSMTKSIIHIIHLRSTKTQQTLF